MARLPSAETLGGLPSAASGRQISSIDGSAIGQGMQSMASGMRALAAGQAAQGRGLAAAGQEIAQGIDIAARSFKQDDDLIDAQARSDFLVEKIKLDNERDQEIDPGRLSQFPQRYQELTQRFAQQYGDPRRRQKFLIDTQDDITRSSLAAGNRQAGIERDTFKASSMERLETLRRAGLEAKDEATKSKIVQQGMEQFRLLRERGVIDASQEVSARQKWVRDYTIESIKMLPPEERLAATDGWRGALKVRESKGDHGAENTFGFAGYYQFGAPRLQTIGVYTPGQGENLETWNKTSKTAPGKWSGTFNIPGFPNVKTKADFLANPAAQEAVFDLHQKKMDQEMKAMDLERFIGQTRGGVTLTRESIYAMMHLGGPGGAADALKGVRNREDAYGTKVLEYAALGTKGPSKMLDFLDAGDRMEIQRGAAYELMQKARASEAEQRQAASIANAERVARNNELEVGILDGAYGREEVMRRREMGDLTDADQIRKIDGLLRDQEKRIVSERAAVDILEGRTTANPYDPAAQDIAEAAEKAIVRGSNGAITPAQASLVVFDKFGGRILTKTGAAAIRGGIESPDAEEVQRSVAVASQMMQRNPLIFNSVQGGDKIEKAANLFTHLIDNRNMNPVQAAQRVVEMQRPEYKKTLRLDETQEKSMMDDLRKNAMRDLEKATFQGSSRIPFTSNTLGFSPKQQMEASQTYAEEVIDHYREYGDLDAAKAHALKSMEKFYGVSNGVLMKYPPENIYPRDSSGSHDWLYKQAAQDIKAVSGKTVEPSNVFLIPHSVRTGEAFRAGQPAPYQVVWREERDGQTIHHYLPQRQAFYGDIRKWISENEKPVEQQFNAARVGTQPPPVTVNPRSWKPGRPMKSQDEIAQETMAAQAERDRQQSDLREAGTRGQAGGTGTAAERNKRIREGIAEKQAGETKPRLPVVTDWIESTPSLRDAMPKIQLGPRSRLPGKKDQ